ncbi:MAG: hypothetical protein WDZ27_06385 [Waddliaceae bacterium]
MRFKKLLLSAVLMTFVGVSANCSGEEFTGKVTRNKVRLRLNPNLDGPVIRQVNQGEMFVVVGEVDDYYIIEPPKGSKAYIYRPYVLDGVVEGSNVNVRLEPSVDSPVVAQLNTGDRVKGAVSPVNNKWLEINAPETARFYIAKDYLTNVGDRSYLKEYENRLAQATDLLAESSQIAQWELSRPFEEIDLNQAIANYNAVISDYQDFPNHVNKAKNALANLQEDYLKLKVDYLENATHYHSKNWEDQNYQFQRKIDEKSRELQEIESRLQFAKQVIPSNNQDDWDSDGISMNGKMTEWIPAEQRIYQKWAQEHEGSFDDFYADQQKDMVNLRGIVEVYERPVRNKPGNYILINHGNQLPIAFIYSTKVNLQNKIGEEVSLNAVLRPNNNFAFPAYFVLSID